MDIMDAAWDNPPTPTGSDVTTFSIFENQPVGSHVGTITSTLTGNWGLGGPDIDDFFITTGGEIKARKVFDYDAKNRYTVMSTRAQPRLGMS